MRENKIFAIVSLIFLMSISFGCKENNSSFCITLNQITQLLNDSAYSHSFIENWNLKNCHEDSIVKTYCDNDSQIVYVVSKTGYFIAIEGLHFEGFENLLYNLRISLNSSKIDNDEIYRKHLGDFELDYIEYFYNDDYDISIAKKEIETKRVYVVSVNRGNIFR